MKFETIISDEAAFLRDSTPEKQMLFKLLEAYWGRGDGDKPPQFIFDAARMCGYPLSDI